MEMIPGKAYIKAKNNPDVNITYYQEIACKNMFYAYLFAQNIPGADIDYCLNACKNSEWYYQLLMNLPQIIARHHLKLDK